MIRSTHAIVDSPFTKGNYVNGLPDFVGQQYSLAFVASAAERLQDYDVNTLYFRDALFNRVPATFSRTSSATRVNKQGLIETVATGIPRIDYTNGSAKLLMEPARTNIIPTSQAISTWSTSNVLVTGSANTSPDGLSNGTLIVATAISAEHYTFIGAPSLAINNVVTASCFFKAHGTNTFVQLVIGGIGFSPTNPFANFNLTGNGSVTAGNYTSAFIENYGNGWYRCGIRATATSNGTPIVVISPILASNTGRTATFTGDGINGVYAWGAQLEVGSYPTSYIPTTGSAVTRNRDTLVNIGKNTMLSDHTFYWQADSKVTPPVIQSIFNDLNNSQFIMQPSTSNALIINTTATGYNQTGFTFYNKLADGITLIEKRAGNDVTVYEDGYFATQTVSGDFNRLDFIANLYSNLGSFNNTWQVQKIIFFPTALTDSECIQLTS